MTGTHSVARSYGVCHYYSDVKLLQNCASEDRSHTPVTMDTDHKNPGRAAEEFQQRQCSASTASLSSADSLSDIGWSDIFEEDEEDECRCIEAKEGNGNMTERKRHGSMQPMWSSSEGEEYDLQECSLGTEFDAALTGMSQDAPFIRQTSLESSQVDSWTKPEETLILLDFDDTLCPTSYALENPKCKAGENPDLHAHEAAVSRFLHVAASYGQVHIVTMATNKWAKEKINDLMPSLWHTIQELRIPIVSSRANLSSHAKRAACSDERNPSHFLKARAMKRIIREFYKDGDNRSRRSWKNILSIGDSEAERFALQDIVFRHTQRDREGGWKECRCKTLLLLPYPTVAELTVEIKFAESLLPFFVHHDGDLHMDLDEDDLQAVTAVS